MMRTIKSELFKLFSVRSTYVTALLGLAFITFLAFYLEGYRGLGGSNASQGADGALQDLIINVGSFAMQLCLIITVLISIHEYRHNLIFYTVTAARSRTQILLSKLLIVVLFSFIFTLLAILWGILSYRLGLSLRNATLAPQSLDFAYTLGRVLLYSVGFSILGFFIANVARSIAITFAAVFVLPNIIEPLIGLLLKENAVYLPFSALNQLVVNQGQPSLTMGALSPGRAAVVTLVYLVIGWVICWSLFLKRDAN